MPTRPTSPDPSGSTASDAGNPFAGMGAGLGAGLDFFQDWLKAAGSALPNLQGASGTSGSSMPAWSMPTLDPAELDKRIQDLKTVQFWLEQNARMIAMSIQGLEVQRMTLTTLKGMNVSMDALRDSLKARAEAPPAPSQPPPAPPPRPAPAWHASTRRDEEDAGSDDPPAKAPPPADEATASDKDAPELINPMRWWDTLTQQFTHLASQAAQTVGESVGDSMDRLKQAQAKAGGHSTSGKATAAKSGRKPAAKKAAAKTRARRPAARSKPDAP